MKNIDSIISRKEANAIKWWNWKNPVGKRTSGWEDLMNQLWKFEDRLYWLIKFILKK